MSADTNRKPHFGDIMVVDDNNADLKLMSDILTEVGYTVRPASDADIALRSLKAKSPDLIIMDINLPGLDGVEACRILKNDAEIQDIPVLFISSHQQTEYIVQALEAGGTDYVSKPINPAEVLARIQTHLKIHRLQMELSSQTEMLKQEIEERKLADQKASSFHKLIESSLTEMYIIDTETLKFTDVNKGARENLGYSLEELKLMTPIDIKPQYSSEMFFQLLEPLKSGSKTKIIFSTIHRRKDGTEYPVEIHLRKTENSSPVYQAMVLDISERIEAKDNLHDSEERFRAAFESAKDCVVIWDKNYNYLYANQASIDHFGNTTDQVVGENIRDGLGHIPKFMNLWMKRIDEVFKTKETGRYQDETIFDGKQFFTDSILSPLFGSDGQVNSVCVLYRDVTDLIVVKKALQDSYDLINRSSAVAFLWKNTEGWPVENVTDNVMTLFGHSAEDFVSGKITYPDSIHPDDLERVGEEVAMYSQSPDVTDFNHDPYRIVSQCGKTKWVDDRTRIRRDKGGNITHYEGIVVDITEKINADDNRKRLENNLYQLDKMASVGQLAAGVAHEINNPIGYISANLRTMKQYYLELADFLGPKGMTPPASDVEIKEMISDFGEAIDESLEGARRVKQIVDDMKGFSRLDASGLEMADLNKGLEATLNIVWNQIKYNCKVEKDLGDIPFVECHANQINQVILNLLVNAGQATEGISGLIKIKTWADNEKVHLSISDNGYGIPQENLSRLFDAFFTTKDVGEGTGLGLSLSHDIVKKHGGDIVVKSEVGKGTEFVVSLPLVYSLETSLV